MRVSWIFARLCRAAQRLLLTAELLMTLIFARACQQFAFHASLLAAADDKSRRFAAMSSSVLMASAALL